VTIIPAIDILEGRCVRLTRGSYAEVSVYNDDPADVAATFERAGAARIHLVDLDAARGSGNNRQVIRRIRERVGALLEVGGGVRDDADVAELLDAGVNRVVVGTVLALYPDRVQEWCRRYGSVVIAGIDALDGRVRVSGWQEDAPLIDTDLAARARDIGCVSIIYTSIAQDGMLAGPDIARTSAVADAAGVPVILSGGISSAADIEQVASGNHPNLFGIIVGKALYAGRIDLPAVMRHYAEDGRAAESRRVW